MQPELIVSTLAGIGALACAAYWVWDLTRPSDRVHVGATEEWRPKAEYRANPPAVHIQRSQTLRRIEPFGPRHLADAYARPHNHQPRHGFTTDRDPLMAARIEKTDLFDTNELHAMLDAELVLVQPVRTETGDGWAQPALRLRGLPPVVEEITR